MIAEIRADINRYRSVGVRPVDLWLNPAVWCLIWYRFGFWIYHTRLPFLLRVPLKVIYRIGYIAGEIGPQMCISAKTKIGPGLRIEHVGGIHLSPEAVIGSNCDISHHVTLGDSAASARPGAPHVGDGVYIGTGALLVGPITVGNGARIAGLSLVLSDVPEGATVLGVPARVAARAAAAVA